VRLGPLGPPRSIEEAGPRAHARLGWGKSEKAHPPLPLRFFRPPWRKTQPRPATTDGRTVFAIGDVHGRLDLLEPLLGQIRASLEPRDRARPPALIFLGDYIDRGADSRGVIEQVIALRAAGDFDVHALKGNHEEAVLTFLQDANFGPTWCEQGGAQTLSSYGVTPPLLRTDTPAWERASAALGAAMPDAHLRFLADLDLTAVYGDYVFVHAGLRPGTPLEAQREHDLLWIRQDFLAATRPFEKVVVHGHTPEPEPFVGDIRIGLDTGAYATGVLTAIKLRDAERTLIQSRLQRPA